MTKFLHYIQSAFDTHSKGASAKKLSAFVVMLCVTVAHIAWIKKCFLENDFSLLTTVLPIDYAFVLALYGITSYDKKLKKDENIKPNADTTTA